MQLFHFNPFKSMTLQGTAVALGTYVYSHLDPTALTPTTTAILQAAGVLWAVFGQRNAVAKNGAGR